MATWCKGDLRVLCAIPCLDEEVAIGSVVLRARRHAKDILVVDDGSTDSTAEVARLAGATVLRHPENRGKGEAYRTVWAHARKHGYDALVVLDGDGQHDPDEVPLLLAKLAEGNDFVIGARWGESTQMPVWRKVGKRVLDYGTAMASESGTKGTGPKLTDSQSGFRAYSRKALEAIEPREAGFSVESQLLIDAHDKGLRIDETRIHCRYDVDSSTETPLRHASGVLNDLLVAVGVRHPLLFLGVPGVLSLCMSIAAAARTLGEHDRTGVVPLAWIMVTMFTALVGIVGLFAGLLFNILPRIIQRAALRPTPTSA
ncbi:MAG TPA: glycosyltransferase family 2 protein [Candidatus Thermoplasmatota archaeon]|nr:glycosyltransferase family 2 protein [Candidatus Thermoplasmatota archaeon]